MNIYEQLRNRWRSVFEVKTADAQIRKMRESIPETQILADIDSLQKRVDALEKDLAASLQQTSSKWGSLVVMNNGELFYRVNGRLMPLSFITRALKVIHTFKKDNPKLYKTLGKENADILAELEIAFRDPWEEQHES